MSLRFLYAVLVFVSLAAIGCRDSGYYNGIGKKPKYIPVSQLGDIQNLPPQDIGHAGVIYLQNDTLFMVEINKGIHVFDASDTANPVNITFIKIPAVTDFTINGHMLYADNGTNMVSIDISDILHVQVVATVPNAFQPYRFPPLYNGPFECADPSKGVVVDWVDTLLVNAKCHVN